MLWNASGSAGSKCVPRPRSRVDDGTRPQGNVAAHCLHFHLCQRAGFQQNGVVGADIACVMQKRTMVIQKYYRRVTGM